MSLKNRHFSISPICFSATECSFTRQQVSAGGNVSSGLTSTEKIQDDELIPSGFPRTRRKLSAADIHRDFHIPDLYRSCAVIESGRREISIIRGEYSAPALAWCRPAIFIQERRGKLLDVFYARFPFRSGNSLFLVFRVLE